jgi:hypothetical protein
LCAVYLTDPTYAAYFNHPFVDVFYCCCCKLFYHFVNDRFFNRPAILRVTKIWTVLIAPLFFLCVFDLSEKNDCCSDSAVFAPDNRIGIYVFIILCIAAYLYSFFRKRFSTPTVELLINSLLVLGVFLNIMISIQINTHELGEFLWILGNIPIIMLFITMMKKN